MVLKVRKRTIHHYFREAKLLDRGVRARLEYELITNRFANKPETGRPFCASNCSRQRYRSSPDRGFTRPANVDFQTFGVRAFKVTLLCKSLMRALFCFGLPSE
jgi:hypothetical protein